MASDIPDPDYPYYDGKPVEISPAKWLLPLSGVALAAFVLLGQLPIFAHDYARYAPPILLAFLPLAGFAIATGRHWTALFRKVGLKDIGWMFGFAFLNYAIAIPLGFLTISLVETQANPGIQGMAASSNLDQFLFFAASIPQLIGEELITILPFLAIIYFLTKFAKVGRTAAVIVAWLVTAVWFAAIHLPTYNYNFLQCLILIGGARLVLTLAYMKTKNLWVSAGAHIINDWITFGLAVIGASMGASAG